MPLSFSTAPLYIEPLEIWCYFWEALKIFIGKDCELCTCNTKSSNGLYRKKAFHRWVLLGQKNAINGHIFLSDEIVLTLLFPTIQMKYPYAFKWIHMNQQTTLVRIFWVWDDEPGISTRQMLWSPLLWFTFDWAYWIHSMVVFGRQGFIVTQSWPKNKINSRIVSMGTFLDPEI